MHTRTITALAVGLVATMAAASAADARPITKADRKIVKAGLVHVDAMAGILNKWMSAPTTALDHLERYVKKHRKRIIQLKIKSDQIKAVLDKSDQTTWRRMTSGAPETLRMFRAAMMFWKTHRKNPEALARMKKLFLSVQPPKKKPTNGKSGSKRKKK